MLRTHLEIKEQFDLRFVESRKFCPAALVRLQTFWQRGERNNVSKAAHNVVEG